MNTSIPTASADLATLVGAAPQSAPSCAQLKGLMAGLKAKSAPADEAGSAGSDFASLLDAPGGGTGNSLADSSAQTGGDDSAPAGRNLRTVLSVAISPVASVTLQIKGMMPEQISVCPLPATPVPMDTPVVSTLPGTPTDQAATPTPEAAPEGVVPETTLGRRPRTGDQAKVLPGLGRFLRSCGRHASEGLQSMLGKGPAVSYRIPVASDSELGKEIIASVRSKASNLPVAPTGVPCNPEAIIAADLSLTLATGQGNQPPAAVEASVTASVPVFPETGPSLAPLIPVSTPVATTVPVNETTVAPAHPEVATQSPVSTPAVENAAPIAAPVAPLEIAGSVGVIPLPTTDFSAAAVVNNQPVAGPIPHRYDFLSAMEKGSPSTAVSELETDEDFRRSIPLALKREIIESVAAVLAPLMVNVLHGTAIMPTPPAAGDATGSNPGKSAAEKTPLSATVMVRLGSQPSFRIELPLPAALLSAQPDQVAVTPAGATDLVTPTSDPTPVGQAPLGVAADDSVIPAALTGPAADSAEAAPFDFQLPLKAMIDQAWVQAQPVAQNDQAELLAAIGEQVAALNNPAFGNEPAVKVTAGAAGKSDPAATPVALMIKVPGLGSIVAQITTANPAAQKISLRPGLEAKTAAENRGSRGEKKADETISERIFLNAGNQSLKSKPGDAGISVAKFDDTMPAPFTSRRVAVEQLELPSRISARDFLPAGFGSPAAAAPAETPAVSTPAPVVAHRAIETIFNVVEAQRNGLSNATSVNLHFKFGGDDLAVRVQLRGGEVQTQFLTDSPDLRAALASEWQTLASQGVASSLKLIDPVIMPASANVSTGFGSASQGQGHAQHQAQQQHQAEQAAAAFPELRTLRRGLAAADPKTAPRPATVDRANAQHLAALA